eukprot:1569979-Rhodomonas_salina.4
MPGHKLSAINHHHHHHHHASSVIDHHHRPASVINHHHHHPSSVIDHHHHHHPSSVINHPSLINQLIHHPCHLPRLQCTYIVPPCPLPLPKDTTVALLQLFRQFDTPPSQRVKTSDISALHRHIQRQNIQLFDTPPAHAESKHPILRHTTTCSVERWQLRCLIPVLVQHEESRRDLRPPQALTASSEVSDFTTLKSALIHHDL